MSTSKKLKDSGLRKEFKSGGQKDPSSRIKKGRYDLLPTGAIRRLALLYSKGASKYEDRNWEKGIPFSVCIDSLLRHAFQWLAGERDEDHLAAVAFWAFALMHFEEKGRKDLEDLPWGENQSSKRIT
ncbi:MAG: hypothetical protein JRI45_06770 [Deltaproteobacteria bacterium]|nr:hypothetical protein [Deltaproteobacteria bacterium]